MPKKLVGTGGVMAPAAAGFLFSQASQAGATLGSMPTRSKVASVVTFDTALTNRVNARVDKLSDINTVAALFTVTAGTGTLTSLRYINTVDNKLTPVVGTTALPSAAGILVSFDGSDGSVATVLPYNATRAVGHSIKPERQGDTLVFRGGFTGAWDGKGENTAPGGAHVIRLDAKTGKLIEAR